MAGDEGKRRRLASSSTSLWVTSWNSFWWSLASKRMVGLKTRMPVGCPQQKSSGPLAQEVTAGAEMDFVNILLHNFLSSQLK